MTGQHSTRLAQARREDGYYYDEEETRFENAVDFVLGAEIGFCTCGQPEELLRFVRDSLTLIKLGRRAHTPGENFFAHWADSRGFAEHGIGLGACWLTDEGNALLADVSEALDAPAAP